MALLLHLLVLAATQDVDQVADAEALATAVDAAQRLLRRDGRIPRSWRGQAVVAVAAGLGIGLTEAGQQHLATALHRFAVAQQVVELGPLQLLAFFTGLGLLDHLLEQHHIAQAVAQPGLGRLAIATGAAGFLVVAFHRLGQVGMRDKAHVRLVDAHAEGDGGAHHDAVLAQEAALVVGAHLRRQSGVVGQGIEALAAEEFGGLLDLAPRHAVDDAGLATMAMQEISQLLAGIVLLHHGVADVGAVEGTDEVARFLQVEALGDLALGRRIGGGGQRDPRDLRPTLVQHGQLAVLGAEIMAPLRHAVCFVDGEQGDLAARQQRQEAAGQQPLGSDIEHVQLTREQFALDAAGGLGIQG